MNMGYWIRLGSLTALLWALAGTATATVCGYLNDNRPAVGTMPLQVASITVGRDVELGAVVYRQRYTSGSPIIADCSGPPFDISIGYNFRSTPRGLSSWSTGIYAGKVYLTDVAGLGVVYNSPRQGVLPRVGSRAPFCSGAAKCSVHYANVSEFELLLIKIGNVGQGTILGENLPTVQNFMDIGNTNVMGFTMGISGSINIVSRTCDTPNITVPMGSYMTSEFKGLNSATPWKNFAITLNNCPAFQGSYSGAGPSWTANAGNNPGGSATNGTLDSNTLQFRIDPSRAPINAPSGVLALDPAAAGFAPAAGGVGVQIATSRAELPLATAQSSGLTLNTTSSSYSIPLRARYLQTSAPVTPGPANASATFTIIYQ